MTTKPSTTTQTRELEPCLFCGAKPELIREPDEVHYYVMCFECGTCGPDLHGEQDAINAWNTRAVPSTTEQREALGAILVEAEFVGDAKQPFSTWVAERCRAALQPKAEAEGE